MGVLVRQSSTYKSGLGIFISPKGAKLALEYPFWLPVPVLNLSTISNYASRWATDKCEGSNWGRILPGIQWAWSQTRDTCPTSVLHVIYTWLSYYWSIWATDKCEGSKWGRILSGIQWAWSQTRDMCPSRVIHVIYTWLSYFWSL